MEGRATHDYKKRPFEDAPSLLLASWGPTKKPYMRASNFFRSQKFQSGRLGNELVLKTSPRKCRWKVLNGGSGNQLRKLTFESALRSAMSPGTRQSDLT